MKSIKDALLVLGLVVVISAGVAFASWPSSPRLFRITFTQDQSSVLYEATSMDTVGFCTTFYQNGTRVTSGDASAVICTSHLVVEMPRGN